MVVNCVFNTVGYGDVSPVTAVGKLIGAVTAKMGVCSIAHSRNYWRRILKPNGKEKAALGKS